MIEVEISGDVLTCEVDEWSGPNESVVGLLNTQTQEVREEFAVGADPDPDATMIKVAKDLFGGVKLLKRDPIPKSESGIVY